MPARDYQLTNLVSLFLKWRYPLLGVLLAAALISAGVSLLLPNEFKSTTVFYATNLNTINPDQVVGGSKQRDPELFGNAEDIDRILTIAYSQPLAEFIIRKHHLASHYGMDTTSEKGQQYVLDEFLSNYNAVHTERDALEITFFDKDKNLAAIIANDIASRIDELNQQLTYENRRKVLDIFGARYHYLQKQYFQMQDSLQQSRKRFRIFGSMRDTHESRHESRFLAKQLVETETSLRQAKAEADYLQKAGGNVQKLSDLRARINGLEKAFAALSTANGNLINYQTYMEGTDVVGGLENQLAALEQEYIKARKSYMDAELALKGKISTIYVVQKAIPATKKSKPVRWVIVVGSTLLAFLLSITLIALLEYNKSALVKS